MKLLQRLSFVMQRMNVLSNSSKRDAPQFGVCSLFRAIGKDILDERGWNYTLNLVKVFCVRSLLKATTPKKQWNRR